MRFKNEEIEKKIAYIAKRLFVKNGYKKTGMRDIAKLTDISLSNIYTYFSNKDEILKFLFIEDYKKIESFKRWFLIDIAFSENTENIISDFMDFYESKKEEIFFILKEYSRFYLINPENEKIDDILFFWNNSEKNCVKDFILMEQEFCFGLWKNILLQDLSREKLKKHLDIFVKYRKNGLLNGKKECDYIKRKKYESFK